MKVASLLALACSTVLAQDLFLGQSPVASEQDLSRAHRVRPYTSLLAAGPADIATRLNQRLELLHEDLRDCHTFSLPQLDDLVETMWPHLSPHLQHIYTSTAGGIDLRAKRFASLQEYRRKWQIAVPEHDLSTIRDAKCAEVLLFYAHHLPEASRVALRGRTLPRLPVYSSKSATGVAGPIYDEAFTCSTGHNMTLSSTSDHRWPHWPADLYYRGRGHGVYPFWQSVHGTSETGSADIEVWWSETHRAERFDHVECHHWLIGDGVPCTQLMLAGDVPTSYFYPQDRSSCCISDPLPDADTKWGKASVLAPVQSDFMDLFACEKNLVDFEGDYFSGRVRNCTLTLPPGGPVEKFWYMMTPEGLPVQQGEGGFSAHDVKPPVGHLIWHDYNQSSFSKDPMPASVFEVPEICRNTTEQCVFP